MGARCWQRAWQWTRLRRSGGCCTSRSQQPAPARGPCIYLVRLTSVPAVTRGQVCTAVLLRSSGWRCHVLMLLAAGYCLAHVTMWDKCDTLPHTAGCKLRRGTCCHTSRGFNAARALTQRALLPQVPWSWGTSGTGGACLWRCRALRRWRQRFAWTWRASPSSQA
jgi:hypothetical protein